MTLRSALIASALSPLKLLRRPPKASAMSDADYLSAGKASNQADYRATPEPLVLCLLHEEDGFEWLMEVPFALKQLIDVHAVMRHAVAVAGEREVPLTHHSLFHPAFAAFALGFCQGLVATHRRKHLRWHGEPPELSPLQREQCENWGVEMATYYLAAVENYGVFGKVTDGMDVVNSIAKVATGIPPGIWTVE